MRKNKSLIISILAILVVCSMGALGVWYASITGFAVFEVTSGDVVIEFTTLFQNQTLDTTLGADVQLASATINNMNGILGVNISTLVEKNDVDDLCTDYLTDCEVVFELNSEEVIHGDSVNLTPGSNSLDAIASCKQYSCPGKLNITVTLEQTG